MGSCGSFSFSVTINSASSTNNGVIALDTTNKILTIYTSNSTYRGYYTVSLTGAISTYSLTSTVTFYVYVDIPYVENTAPYFSENLKDLIVKAPSVISYSLPTTLDKENDSVSIKVIIPKGIGRFVKYGRTNGMLIVEAAERYIGSYSVTI